MKYIFSLLVLSIAFSFSSYSQENDSITYIYEIADTPAEPIGGLEAIYKWIGANMNYELIKSADTIECENARDGRVFISYIIDEQGELYQPEIVKSLGEPYDSEALRLIAEMPIEWTPGSNKGKKVKMRNVTVIKFCSGKIDEVKNKNKSRRFNRRKN